MKKDSQTGISPGAGTQAQLLMSKKQNLTNLQISIILIFYTSLPQHCCAVIARVLGAHWPAGSSLMLARCRLPSKVQRLTLVAEYRIPRHLCCGRSSSTASLECAPTLAAQAPCRFHNNPHLYMILEIARDATSL